jgi:hypothetical protein
MRFQGQQREQDVKTSNMMRRLNGASAAAAIAVSLALAGCNQPTATDNAQAAYALPALPPTLPLATGSATPVNAAPQAAALPDVKPIAVAHVSSPTDAYAYADDAQGFSDAIGDAPPDYGFDYGNGEPWAWQGYDDSVVFAEPIDDGYRYYYYRPGADEPYFVRDPDYGYGYANGSLAVVYGPGGAIVPYGDYGPRVTYASRYYARGHDLWQASRQRQRRPVVAANWAARQNAIASSQQRWAEERAHQQDWQAYHARTAPQEADHWSEEQARRRADTVRFADWRQQDYRTPPPPRAIPADWTKHKWAQDQDRFAPPAPGFNGNAAQRAQAAHAEQERLAALAARERASAQQQQAQQRAAQDKRQALSQRQQQQQQAHQSEQRAQAEQQRLHDQSQQAQKARQDAARQQAAKAQQQAATQRRAQAAQKAQHAKQQADAARQQATQATAQRRKQQADAARQKAQQQQQQQHAKDEAAARAKAQADAKAKADQRAQAQAAQQRAQADQRAKAQAAAKDQAAQRAKAQADAKAKADAKTQAAAKAQAQLAAAQAAHAKAQAHPRPQQQPHQGGPARQKRPDQP